MANGQEGVRSALSEVNKFINVTLRSESLSKTAQHEKNKIKELLERLYAENDWLQDEGSCSSSKDSLSVTGSLDDSRSNVDSTHSDTGYDENIAPCNVKSLTDPIKLGYLDWKQRELLISSWQKRYVVLHKNILYCFKKPSDKKQQCALVVTGYDVKEAPNNVKEVSKKEGSFELVCPGKKTIQLLTDSKEELELWREAIQKANSESVVDGVIDEIYEEFHEVPEKSPIAKSSPLQSSSASSVSNSETTAATGFLGSMASMFKGKKGKQDVASADKKDKGHEDSIAETNPNVDEFEDDDMIYEFVEEPPNAAASSKTASVSSPKVDEIKEKTKDVSKPASSSSSPDGSASGSFPPPPVSASVPPPLPPHIPTAGPPPPLPSRSEPRAPLPSLPPPPSQPLPPIPNATPAPASLQPVLGEILLPSEDFENMFYGLWGCQGSSEEELSFQRGEVIHVLCREVDETNNWWVGELNGSIGLVPKTFLSPAFEIVA